MWSRTTLKNPSRGTRARRAHPPPLHHQRALQILSPAGQAPGHEELPSPRIERRPSALCSETPLQAPHVASSEQFPRNGDRGSCGGDPCMAGGAALPSTRHLARVHRWLRPRRVRRLPALVVAPRCRKKVSSRSAQGGAVANLSTGTRRISNASSIGCARRPRSSCRLRDARNWVSTNGRWR